MILYPGTSLHRVEPVTRGVRLAAFFWVQSMVRDDSQRALLFDLDTAIQQLAARARQPGGRAAVQRLPQPAAAMGRHLTRRIIGQLHLWIGLVLCLPLVMLGADRQHPGLRG